MVGKKHYRDRKSGINSFDFWPSKPKPLLALVLARKHSWTVSHYCSIIFCWTKLRKNPWRIFIIFFLFSFSFLEISFQMFKSILQKLKLLCTATSIWVMDFWEMKEWRFHFCLRSRFWNIQNIIMTCLIEFSNKIIKTSNLQLKCISGSKLGPTINLTQSISLPLSFSRLSLDRGTSVKVNGHVDFLIHSFFQIEIQKF